MIASLRHDLGPVGLWTLALDGLPVHEIGEWAVEVEQAGLRALWFGEARGREAFSLAQLLLQRTRSVVVGSSIANIWGRDAVAARSAQAMLGALYPGRFVLGLGVSHAPVVSRYRGHEYVRPLDAMTRYLRTLDEVAPRVPDAPPARPRVIAALGPRMLEVARDQADGAAPYLTLPEHTNTARQILGPDRLLVTEVSAVVSGDRDTWRRRAGAHLDTYVPLENYRRSWRRQGFADSDAATKGGSERLRTALVAHGLEDTLVRVEEHLDAGADHVAVQVLADEPSGLAREDVRRYLEAVASWPAADGQACS